MIDLAKLRADIQQEAKLVVNADVALIEAEQALLAPGKVIARKRDFAIKNAWLAHAAQSFLCIP